MEYNQASNARRQLRFFASLRQIGRAARAGIKPAPQRVEKVFSPRWAYFQTFEKV